METTGAQSGAADGSIADEALAPDVVGAEGTALLTALLSVLAGAVFLSWALLAVVHRADRFDVGWGQGAWMGLAQSARHGVLYVPLYHAGHFGGTRFMPIPILALAQLARATGEYLASGKIFAYVSFALLLVVMFLVLRSLRCPTYLALGLTAVPLVTGAGLFIASGIGADALPVALQLVALALISRFTERRWTIAAAVACTLAVFTKESALWAPLAIVIWLALKDRRRLVDFLAGFLGLSAVLAVVFTFATDGRFLSNVLGLSFSGVSSIGSIVRPITFFPMLLTHAAAASLLLPVAAIELWLSVRRRTLTIYHVGLACALVVLAVVLTDAGADYNHLIDVIVLISVVVGVLASRLVRSPEGLSMMGATVVAIIGWALLSSYVGTMFLSPGGVLDALNGTKHAEFARRSLAGQVSATDVILSEDPVIPIQLGQRPVVLDAFMLLRIGKRHPDWIGRLIERIDARAFSKVILTRPLDADQRSWYETFHFGPAVFSALRANYVERAREEGYYIYTPRSP